MVAKILMTKPQTTQLTMAKIEVSIPRKQGAAAMGRDKALAKFHDQVRMQVHKVWGQQLAGRFTVLLGLGSAGGR